MNTLAVFFIALVTYVIGAPLEAERYPANLDPALCPDYPICDISLLFGLPATLPMLPEMPVEELPVAMALPQVPMEELPVPMALPEAPALNLVVPIDNRYPPGVHPSACPNYPFCNVSELALPLPGFATRLYPPGVHPSACPAYPNC